MNQEIEDYFGMSYKATKISLIIFLVSFMILPLFYYRGYWHSYLLFGEYGVLNNEKFAEARNPVMMLCLLAIVLLIVVYLRVKKIQTREDFNNLLICFSLSIIMVATTYVFSKLFLVYELSSFWNGGLYVCQVINLAILISNYSAIRKEILSQ